jgi:hypothetical protein
MIEDPLSTARGIKNAIPFAIALWALMAVIAWAVFVR